VGDVKKKKNVTGATQSPKGTLKEVGFDWGFKPSESATRTLPTGGGPGAKETDPGF